MLHGGRTAPVAAAAFVDRPDLRARSPSSRPTQAVYALLRNSGLGRAEPSRVVAETCCGVSDPRDGRSDLRLNRLDVPKSSSVSVLLFLSVLILSRFKLMYCCLVLASEATLLLRVTELTSRSRNLEQNSARCKLFFLAVGRVLSFVRQFHP